MNKYNAKRNTYCINEIAKATLELLNEKPINKISISEIIQKSLVARSTFYRNFDSILDILSYHLKNILKGEFEKKYIFVGNYRDFLLNLMEFCLKYKDICLILARNDLLMILINKIIEEIQTNKNIKSEIEKYGITSLIFGLYGWVYAWFKDDLTKSPQEIMKMFDTYQKK